MFVGNRQPYTKYTTIFILKDLNIMELLSSKVLDPWLNDLFASDCAKVIYLFFLQVLESSRL